MTDIIAAITSIGLTKVIGAVLVVGLFVVAIKAMNSGKKNGDKNSNKSNDSQS